MAYDQKVVSSLSHCYHGGAFFDAVGVEFGGLEKSADIINADVLDAWFPPSPKVIDILKNHLSWLIRTSPPTCCEGMINTISRVRGIDRENILPGGGSSDLIFLALQHWLRPSSRVLILDPTYGEYIHVLENIIGCHVDRYRLSRMTGYSADAAVLLKEIKKGYDLAILVNPNTPTGQHIPRHEMEELLQRVPVDTRVWIDETYVEYIGSGQSLEQYATGRKNVIVCKSMSKVYALSGVRAAYLCAAESIIDALRRLNPPWAVSTLGQAAAIAALNDPGYYAERYKETGKLRTELCDRLSMTGKMDIMPGLVNFVLCHLHAACPDAESVTARCREKNLFIRNAGGMGTGLGERAIRIAVKDAETNRRIVTILEDVLACR